MSKQPFKLTVILKNGKTIVLSTSETEEEIKKVFSTILNEIKRNARYVEIRSDSDITLISTDEIAAVLFSKKAEKE